MTERKTVGFRFSIKTLLIVVTLLAVGLGAWIAYSNHLLQRLTDLRQQGAIVVVRNRTPKMLQGVGIKQLHPFYSVPTVELYVTPKGEDALVGSSEQVTSKAAAQKQLLETALEARSYGAKDIQLIVLDNFDSEWMKFGIENSMTVIVDSRQRYLARLRANQETGTNINP